MEPDKEIVHEECGKCGRKLRSAKARKVGFGRVCERKIAEQRAKEEFEKNQQTLDMVS